MRRKLIDARQLDLQERVVEVDVLLKLLKVVETLDSQL